MSRLLSIRNGKHQIINQYRSYTQPSITSTRTRIGIGASKLAQETTDGVYASVIATSLQNSITTFEAGLGGEEKLRRAYMDAIMYLDDAEKQKEGSGSGNGSNDVDQKEVILTGRFGYRTTTNANANEYPNDVFVENSKPQDEDSPPSTVQHNVSKEYVASVLNQCPLVEVYKQRQSKGTKLVYMAHNPEAQGRELHEKGAPLEEVRGLIQERLTDSFVGLETAVAEEQIDSYGVCSNGLSLHPAHPLHLPWNDVLHAAHSAATKIHGTSSKHPIPNLSTLQLPANLLETRGLKVANEVKQFLASPENTQGDGMNLSMVNIFTTRPLTCYSDQGTGQGNPFKLVDYEIPMSFDARPNSSSTQWTHQIQGSTPPFYIPILNETMGHFDATHLLEAGELEGRKLTMEERETLDGCKLIQSMIHDLDATLSSGALRSFAAYEEDLFKKAIPLIHDTFEELDEESSLVLQRFFKVHGSAVRYTIAKTTRDLLKSGGEGGDRYNVDDNMTLQSYALSFLWNQQCNGDFAHGPLIDKVIVGTPKAEHVIEALQAADKCDEKNS